MSSLRAATAFAAELRQAVRRLRWSPGFAALAIGTLAIGVGINTAMFALMDALLFRPPFHVSEPASVVRLHFRIGSSPEPALLQRTSYLYFADVKASGAFEAVAAYDSGPVSIGHGRDASLANAMLVSREFFDVLRPRPHLGNFSLGEATIREGGDRAIISYGFWQQHYGGDPRAVGANLPIDGRVYAVAAVAPRGFQSLTAEPIDLWLPLDHAFAAGLRARDWRDDREASWLHVVGRLAQGTSRSVAEQRATAMLRNRQRALGGTDAAMDVVTSSIVPGRGGNRSLESKVSLSLAGVSAFVLLIACANVSNLVLTRTIAQRQEYLVRLTLGASRWDLVRRSLADTSVIVVPGALGALVVSFLVRNGISGLLAGDLPLSRHFWDERTAAIMAGSIMLAFALVSAVSLLQLRSAITGATSIASGARTVGNAGKSTRRSLLAVQAGLCLALLFVAGLFAASLRRVESLDLGVDLDRTIQLTFNLAPLHVTFSGDPGRRSASETRAIYERVRGVLAKHPSVERVALAAGSPYMSGSGVGPVTAERSFEELWATRGEVAYRSTVGAGFFSTAGAYSLRGRDFDEGDRLGAQPVAIINAPLARYLWPSKEALGECMWMDDDPRCFRIVGVLGGVWKFRVLERDKMAVYLPLAQVADAVPDAVYVRPKGEARTVLGQVRSLAQSVYPDLPAARAVVLREIVDRQFKPWRLGTTVFSMFAAVALVITAIGLYGVVAVATALRLKEIGIRMALGARRWDVVRVVVGEGVTSVAIGLSAGAMLVAVASRWLGSVLFETTPTDAVVLVQTALILFTISAIAAAVPTIRALRTNPANVLRSE